MAYPWCNAGSLGLVCQQVFKPRPYADDRDLKFAQQSDLSQYCKHERGNFTETRDLKKQAICYERQLLRKILIKVQFSRQKYYEDTLPDVQLHSSLRHRDR